MLPPPAQEACKNVWIPAFQQRMREVFEAVASDSELSPPTALDA